MQTLQITAATAILIDGFSKSLSVEKEKVETFAKELFTIAAITAPSNTESNQPATQEPVRNDSADTKPRTKRKYTRRNTTAATTVAPAPTPTTNPISVKKEEDDNATLTAHRSREMRDAYNSAILTFAKMNGGVFKRADLEKAGFNMVAFSTTILEQEGKIKRVEIDQNTGAPGRRAVTYKVVDSSTNPNDK